jgi:hypothetical protein
LGSRCGFVLLPYWKEGRVAEGQVLTHPQEVKTEDLQVEVIRDADRFNSLAPE